MSRQRPFVHRRSQRRIRQRIFEKIAVRGPFCQSCPSIALTSKRIVRRKAKKGAWSQPIGPSRGGRTSEIHSLASDRGRPVAVALTSGNIADIKMAIPLQDVACPTRRLLADKAYDADSLRGWLEHRKINAIIPSPAARRTPYPLDHKVYRRIDAIERLFCRIKDWSRIATPYDRLAKNHLSAVALVSAVIAWI